MCSELGIALIIVSELVCLICGCDYSSMVFHSILVVARGFMFSSNFLG